MVAPPLPKGIALLHALVIYFIYLFLLSARTDCQSCLDETLPCTWDSTGTSAFKGSCFDNSNLPAQAEGIFMVDLAECPAKPVKSDALTQTFPAIIVTLALVFVAFF